MKKVFFSLLVMVGFVTANAQTDSLQQYTGKYTFPDGSPVAEISVTVDNGILMASSAMGSTEFKPTSTADVYEVVAFGVIYINPYFKKLTMSVYHLFY